MKPQKNLRYYGWDVCMGDYESDSRDDEQFYSKAERKEKYISIAVKVATGTALSTVFYIVLKLLTNTTR